MRAQEILQHSLAELTPGPIAIAYSGGLDSTALLHLAANTGRKLFAFHIHHGLSPNADAWESHCRTECERLGGITFAARRVTLDSRSEASARKARYAALGELCTEHKVHLLLTAHHLDDQAETILLQLLRGAGPAGMSGMDAFNRAPTLLGTPDVLLVRPLLQASRADLEEYVRENAIAHIEDESNADTRYARNALRHDVMPRLAEAFPGYQERFARSARHAQSAQRLLTEQAAEDLRACIADAGAGADPAASLDLARLRTLSADRVSNLLRHWFTERGIRLPSASWLAEMQEQALTARDDANLKVTHPDCEVRRHRDRLYLVPRKPEADAEQQKCFRWNGEGSIDFPEFGGTLHFELAPLGLDPDWLRQQMLTIELRKGGEKLKPARNRPTRTLKQHYQTLGIPAWERERLPMVSIPGHILYAAGIGMDCHKLSASAEHRLVFRWETK